MRKAIMISVLVSGMLFAGYVSGHYRSNGTYVSGYQRSESNSNVRDNYSYSGNRNPYTGETGSNKYRKSRSSEFYAE